jgi:hypothetical protein
VLNKKKVKNGVYTEGSPFHNKKLISNKLQLLKNEETIIYTPVGVAIALIFNGTNAR